MIVNKAPLTATDCCNYPLMCSLSNLSADEVSADTSNLEYESDSQYVYNSDNDHEMTRLDCGHPFSESLGLVDAMIHNEPISLFAPCDEPECNSTVLVSSRKPVSEVRVFNDQADASEVVSDKCDSCSNCRCTSDTALGKIRSIHQSLEQECISNSVRVDKEQARTFISLPFIKIL